MPYKGGLGLTKSASAACESCCSAADLIAASDELSVSPDFCDICFSGSIMSDYLPGDRVPVRTAFTSMLGGSWRMMRRRDQVKCCRARREAACVVRGGKGFVVSRVEQLQSRSSKKGVGNSWGLLDRLLRCTTALLR